MYTEAVKIAYSVQETFLSIIFACNLSRYLCTYMVISFEYSIMVCKAYIVSRRESGGERGRESPQLATQEIKIKQPR